MKVTKTGLFLTNSAKMNRRSWQDLAKTVPLNLEALEWSAAFKRTRAVSEISLLVFDYKEWRELSEEYKSKLRPLMQECFKIIELKPSDYESWKQEFSCTDTKTFLIDFEYGTDFWRPGLVSFLKAQELHESKDMLKLGEGLNQLVAQSLQELQRVKKIHETLVPLRTEQMKGLCVMSKFAAGESPGGEFYDVIPGDEEFAIILTHSSSYIVSSLVLSALEGLREKRNFGLEELQNFSLELAQVIKQQAGAKAFDSFQLFIARVDMKSLVIEGLNWGHSQLLSSGSFFVGENDFPIDSSFVEKATFKNKLARSENYVLVSPGMRENCADTIEGEKLISYVRRLMPEGPKKMLQEAFYQLKKRRESSFLKYDATSVFIEVDPNVIVQI